VNEIICFGTPVNDPDRCSVVSIRVIGGPLYLAVKPELGGKNKFDAF